MEDQETKYLVRNYSKRAGRFLYSPMFDTPEELEEYCEDEGFAGEVCAAYLVPLARAHVLVDWESVKDARANMDAADSGTSEGGQSTEG